MIVREFYLQRNDGVNLYRTYSNANYYIKKTGTDEIYTEAIDVESTAYTYEETAEIIQTELASVQYNESRTVYKEG